MREPARGSPATAASMAATMAPVEAPARIPSRVASLRHPRTMSISSIRHTTSGSACSASSGTIPAPSPGKRRGPDSPPNNTEPTASTATKVGLHADVGAGTADSPGACPVVLVATNSMSSRPSTASMNSGIVVLKCASGLSGEPYWLVVTAPGCSASSAWTRCRRAASLLPSAASEPLDGRPVGAHDFQGRAVGVLVDDRNEPDPADHRLPGQGNAEIPGGRFHDHSAGFEPSRGDERFDEAVGRSLLGAARELEQVQLGKDLDPRHLKETLQLHRRGLRGLKVPTLSCSLLYGSLDRSNRTCGPGAAAPNRNPTAPGPPVLKQVNR